MFRSNYLVGLAIVVLGLFIVVSSSFFIVPPGERGVLVTLGKADPDFKPEGVGFRIPMISHLVKIPIRQQSSEFMAPCFSSDLQTLDIKVRLIYRYPQEVVVRVFTEFNQNVFLGVIAPKAQEAIKEVTANRSAEQIVKQREQVKTLALQSLRIKVQGLVVIEDLVLENIDLSKELEKAIEEKMVQEQAAGKAKFSQEQARIEAETAKIRAQGEADAISIRSKALEADPRIIDLMVAEKWNGVAPLVVGGAGSGGTSIILPLNQQHSKSGK